MLCSEHLLAHTIQRMHHTDLRWGQRSGVPTSPSQRHTGPLLCADVRRAESVERCAAAARQSVLRARGRQTRARQPADPPARVDALPRVLRRVAPDWHPRGTRVRGSSHPSLSHSTALSHPFMPYAVGLDFLWPLGSMSYTVSNTFFAIMVGINRYIYNMFQ